MSPVYLVDRSGFHQFHFIEQGTGVLGLVLRSWSREPDHIPLGVD